MDGWTLSTIDEPEEHSETSEKIAAELVRITGDAGRYHVGYAAWLAEDSGKPQMITVFGSMCDGAVLLHLLEQMPAGAPQDDVQKAIMEGVKATYPPGLWQEPLGGIEVDPVTGRKTYWKADR
jgi:hypothetical protein